ncbi:MAG: hypothetical protein HY369_05180 [Candidatus Aenigmarchaeota archaeon]|nr:hypothetical protein [Candidatus Aenigmarchaeota archaeon]
MDTSALVDAGLSAGEAATYLALLEAGSTTAGPVIKKTGFHRATAYALLQRLIEKGLASSVIKGKKRYFEAADPEVLLDVMRERENHLRSLLPHLQVKRELAKVRHEATVYEGEQGMRTVFEMMLRALQPGDEHIVFVAADVAEPFSRFLEGWSRRRARKGVRGRIILNEGARHLISVNRSLPLTEVKTVPREFSTPGEVHVFGESVAIVLWGDRPLAFLIGSRQIADSFRGYFRVLWDQDVTVYHGFEDVSRLFFSRIDRYRPGEEYQVLGATWGKAQRERVQRFFLDYHRHRLEKGVRVTLLGNHADQQALRTGLANAGDPSFSSSRVASLPKGMDNPMQINLYRDEAIIILWTKDPIAFSIRNKQVRDSFKAYFDQLWVLSRKR